MSYPNQTQLGKLKVKLERQNSKLTKLKSGSGDSSVWRDIQIRLLRLQILSTREQITKLLQEMANTSN